MKSDVVQIAGDGKGIAEALKQAQAVAVFKSLSEKDAIRLLLLAEETTGMVKALTGEPDLEFWIETRADVFELHLRTKTLMNYEKREKLLAVSTSGKNSARGFMAKVRSAFEAAICSMDSDCIDTVRTGVIETGGSVNFAYWTLTQYKQTARGDDWDELERSIVAKLADEVKVCIIGSGVEMIIEKRF